MMMPLRQKQHLIFYYNNTRLKQRTTNHSHYKNPLLIRYFFSSYWSTTSESNNIIMKHYNNNIINSLDNRRSNIMNCAVDTLITIRNSSSTSSTSKNFINSSRYNYLLFNTTTTFRQPSSLLSLNYYFPTNHYNNNKSPNNQTKNYHQSKSSSNISNDDITKTRIKREGDMNNSNNNSILLEGILFKTYHLTISQLDPTQQNTLRRLQKLYNTLIGYNNQSIHMEYNKNKQRKQQQIQKQKQEEAESLLLLSKSSSQNDERHDIPSSTKETVRFGMYDMSIGVPLSVLSKPKTLLSSSSSATTTNNNITDEKSTLSSSLLNNNNNNNDNIINNTKSTPSNNNIRQKIPRGLYIYGNVGIGKSMLMNVFYDAMMITASQNNNNNTDTATTDTMTMIHDNTNPKFCRYHYHEFMNMIHQSIDDQYKMNENNNNKSTIQQYDNIDNNLNVIQNVSMILSKQYSLICIDEFQIIDIADFIILSQLLNVLLNMGTILIMTSNRHPSLLYENGIHNNPIIESHYDNMIHLLNRYCVIHEMKGANLDYRTIPTNEILAFNNNHNLDDDDNNTNNNINDKCIPTNVDVHDNTNSGWQYYPTMFLGRNDDNNDHHMIQSLVTPSSSSSSQPPPSTIHDDSHIQQDYHYYRSHNHHNQRYRTNEVTTIIQYIRNGIERLLTYYELQIGYHRIMKCYDADANGLVGRFTFHELCNQCYSAIDYRMLAHHFHVICIEDIPIMHIYNNNNHHNNIDIDISNLNKDVIIDDHHEHNMARRFITLIDELYEAKVALLCTSSFVNNPHDLFIDYSKQQYDETNMMNDNDTQNSINNLEDPHTNTNNKHAIDSTTSSIDMNQTSMTHTGTMGGGGAGIPIGELASIRELSFAFQRASSRIIEMTSPRWWNHILITSKHEHTIKKHHKKNMLLKETLLVKKT